MDYCLFTRFKESVQRHPDIIACQMKQEESYKTYTYLELYELSLKVASYLKQEGIKPQDRIAILFENSPLWPALYFGIIACGATAVPIDTRVTALETNNIIRDSQAKILFTTEKLYLPVKNLLKNILSFKKREIYPFDAILRLKPNPKLTVNNSGDNTASLLYTSGTTAIPKGVMLTHKNLCANFESVNKVKIIIPTDNIISILPLHHSYPFMVNLLAPLLIGAKITYLNSLKSEDLLKCMRETKATILMGVPQLFNILHKSIIERISRPDIMFSCLKVMALASRILRINLNKLFLRKLHENFGSALRFFISGGAKLDKKIAYELNLFGFTILEGYGLTETSPVVTFNPIRKPKIGSVGLPLPGVKVKINSPDEKNSGEILIKGANVMKGYYHKPQETAEVIKDGWFYSGDLGFIDRDGYLYITGRLKEIIVLSSGKNIYPEDVEAHYLKSPYIKEICVFDAYSNGAQSLQAIVVPNIEYFRKTKEINIQNKIRWLLEGLSKELPSYKRVMGFKISKDELPKTHLGKIKRYEIKAQFEAQSKGKPQEKEETSSQPQDDLRLTEADIKILEFLSKEYKRKVKVSDHLELDLGIDSLSRVELEIALERFLKIEIPDDELDDVFTVKELLLKIEKLSAGGVK